MTRAFGPVLLLAAALATPFGWNGEAAPLGSSAPALQAAVVHSPSPQLAASGFVELSVAESAPNGAEWRGTDSKPPATTSRAPIGSPISASGLSGTVPAGVTSSAVQARRDHPSTAPPRRT